MTEFPQIFNTDVINAETDAFWHENTSISEDLTPNKVVVLIDNIAPDSADKTQLDKIISACNLSEGDYTILSFNTDEHIAWHAVKSKLQPSQVISFGINPKRLGIVALFRLNAINHFDDVVIIPTLSLQELEQQPQAKKDLWLNALKPVFVDN